MGTEALATGTKGSRGKPRQKVMKFISTPLTAAGSDSGTVPLTGTNLPAESSAPVRAEPHGSSMKEILELSQLLQNRIRGRVTGAADPENRDPN